ncbi:MAG: hypothetical protein II956_12645 [Bacteroidales bacterium]|nr:hypothetical protein [Bacteroidales bacterium]
MKKLLFNIALLGIGILNSSSVSAPEKYEPANLIQVRIENFTNDFSFTESCFEKYKPQPRVEEILIEKSPP